ncbi:MAG: hypothetical protein HY606_14285 [Planctomycetes bacterium]|nr:hypothetical protein [Planctomycetota bacterium]
MLKSTLLTILSLSPLNWQETAENYANIKEWLKLADKYEAQLNLTKREEAFRKVIEIDPDNEEAHLRLDEKKYQAKWMPADEAEALEEKENNEKGLVYYGSKWITSEKADELREADRKKVKWGFTTKVDTEHLRIFSSYPVNFTRKISAILENEISAYRKFYGKTWNLNKTTTVLRVFIFKDWKLFSEQISRWLQIHEGVTGYYRWTNLTLYVSTSAGNENDEPSIIHTAVHELFHGLDHVLALANSRYVLSQLSSLEFKFPTWLTESRPNHFAHSIFGRQIIPGLISATPNRLLTDGLLTLQTAIESVQITEILPMDEMTFQNKGGYVNYCVTWAFVYFLFHGENGRYSKGFNKFLSNVHSKNKPKHLEEALGVKLAEVENEFRIYVKKELVPKVKK